MKRFKNFKSTVCECGDCGNKTEIRRNLNREREYGHIKDLYCYKCKKETKHKELLEDYQTAQIWG